MIITTYSNHLNKGPRRTYHECETRRQNIGQMDAIQQNNHEQTPVNYIKNQRMSEAPMHDVLFVPDSRNNAIYEFDLLGFLLSEVPNNNFPVCTTRSLQKNC